MKDDQTSTTPDEILVLHAQHRDEEALEVLLERYQNRVYAHCLTLLRNEEAAWDATQNTFLTMLRRLPDLHHASAFRVWLFRLATARARDLQRVDGRLRRLEQIWAEERPVEALEGPAAHRLQLSECLKLLGPEDRELVRLRYIEGFSTAETATILDIPEGTVKSRLYAIRNRLRKLTGDD